MEFAFDVDHQGFSTQNGKIASVKTRTASIEADAYVLALGSYSPLLARPLGIDLPIYPLKGYSVTMPVKDPAAAWTMSLSDEAHKLVLSRLGDRLRIAGTAELNGYDTGINEVRCQAIVKRVQALFPDAGDASKAQFWAGLRPATPTNLPCIGRTRYSNLFLNTGHGTLGWTHACGSGAHPRRPGQRASARDRTLAATAAVRAAAALRGQRGHKPSSERPGWSSGRRPSGQWYFRSFSAIGRSLMLAMRRCMKPCALNSQFSLP